MRLHDQPAVTLPELWDVLAALERGETRAQCDACGRISADPSWCSSCGVLDLEQFELTGLRETLAHEFRCELASRRDGRGPDPRMRRALQPSVN